MTIPIWKDTYATCSLMGITEAMVRVRLDDPESGQTIHVGRVYSKPTSPTVQLRLNDIVRPYLNQLWPSISQNAMFTDAKLEVTVYVIFSDVDTGATLGEVKHETFQYDWSYEDSLTADSDKPRKSFPINGRVGRWQKLLWTTLAESGLEVVPLYNGVPVAHEGYSQTTGTLNYNVSGASPSCDQIRISGGHTDYVFDIVDKCDGEHYVLYYVNSAGGWDFLVIDGKTIKTDTYDRKTFERVYNNSNIADWGGGHMVYKNEITRSWELHTDWLTDDQASRMHHLLGTTMAMLVCTKIIEGIVYNDYIPVTIQNSDCTYKKFATNGHRMASYTILVNEARDITRR